MNNKMKNVLSIVLAVIIAFMIVKFIMHTTLFIDLSEEVRLAISVVSMFVIFIILMFVFNKLLKNM